MSRRDIPFSELLEFPPVFPRAWREHRDGGTPTGGTALNQNNKTMCIAAVLAVAISTPAHATNGMRMIGFGPVQNSMGGEIGRAHV